MLVVVSGRADASPLKYVIDELFLYYGVTVLQLGGSPAVCVAKTRETIDQVKPDIVALLGDRFETLGAAYGATYSRIPICHLHGGESTFGAMDDNMRHAISKLSHIHCVANDQFGDVLKKMGEREIYVTGAPGLDAIKPVIDSVPRQRKNHFVVTYHPETLGGTDANPLISALEQFPGYEVFWTVPNNDPGSEGIMIPQKWIKKFSHKEYLIACRTAACVIGNSSSGIIEAPYLEVPTVNIGDRQTGRPMGRSIFNADNDIKCIISAIEAAANYDGIHFDELYGNFGASKTIAEIIVETDLEGILEKPWAI